MAIAAPRRRADRDEHGVGFGDRRGQVGGETQPPGLDVRRHQRIEPGLENRNLASQQRVDLAGILVHAGDLVAEIGKAGAGHQPHIARANHGDAHNLSDFYSSISRNSQNASKSTSAKRLLSLNSLVKLNKGRVSCLDPCGFPLKVNPALDGGRANGALVKASCGSESTSGKDSADQL